MTVVECHRKHQKLCFVSYYQYHLHINISFGKWRSCSSVATSCLTLCDPMDCSTPGSSGLALSWSLLTFMSISWCCYLTIWSSAATFFFCLPSFPQHQGLSQWVSSASSGQSIGASALVLPVNIQSWFPFFSLHCSSKKAFLSFLAVLWNSAFSWLFLSLSPSPSLLFFPQLFVKPPQTTTLLSCISSSFGWFWLLYPTMLWTSLWFFRYSVCQI